MTPRSEALDRIRATGEPFDVIVIGGGATGLGAAVDAAARGHRVALFERADFAKGTSSRSTKLVHGGVRYLRQGNLSLVLEALRERGRLARNAPHLVHSQAFVIPNYAWWEGPFYGVGMKVYDRLAGSLGLSPSRVLSREQTIELIPTLERDKLVGGVIYHDGQFDDSRLAVNLAQTADDLGATVLNYCECTGLLQAAQGSIEGVEIRDVETGREFAVRARAVINATGVFVDAIRRLDTPDARDIVAVSQGIHLVLPKSFLPGNTAIMVPKTADGRVLFAVPWHGCVVVGTTDTPLSGAAIEPRALDEEREFVLSHARKYLANDPSETDVLSVFAGLRPLVKSGDAGDTAALSRDHAILVSESGLLTITGGKWTTYRKMAQDVVDHAEMVAGLPDRPSRTENLPIHGFLAAPTAADPLAVYGSDAAGIRALMTQRPEWAQLVHPLFAFRAAEVIWHARHEMARTVEDVLARRTRALLLNAAASIDAAPRVAELLAAELGRDAPWQAEQIAAYAAVARGYVFTAPESRGSRTDSSARAARE
jgi:glycerol-3-phosphate dehydrogenase